MSYFQTMYGTDDMDTQFTDKDAYFGELVLRVIRDIDTPMLMYEGEKEAVKKALISALEKWEEMKIALDKYGEELIRCENCAHYGNPLMCPLYRISPPSNGYCYCAERKEE